MRRLIYDLALKDFKTKYLGSYLGIIWAFVQPTFMILIYWFVFQIGFRTMPIGDVPFILWLIAGIIPWFFISEAISSATYSFIENSYLVKKIVFKVSVLPIIKIISSLFVHLVFLVIMFLIFFLYGYSPSWYHLQVFYYLLASIALVYSVSLITSSLVVFLKDVGQIVSILLQMFFWITPIFWNFSMVPEKYQFFFKLNPVFYIVEGYRDTFIYQIGFWHHYLQTAYFWILVMVLAVAGTLIYRKLKPHFADIL
jgi:ABC-type polysaccharide/polyol phosphate export permease